MKNGQQIRKKSPKKNQIRKEILGFPWKLVTSKLGYFTYLSGTYPIYLDRGGYNPFTITRWWQLIFFFFYPDPWGNDFQFDEHIFHMGWNSTTN